MNMGFFTFLPIGILLLAGALFLGWRAAVVLSALAVRAGAGRPWVGLSVVILSAGLGFLGYAMGVGLGTMQRSDGWAIAFGIFALGTAIIGIAMILGSGSQVGVANASNEAPGKRRYLVPILCCLGLAVICALPLYMMQRQASSEQERMSGAMKGEQADLVTEAWYDYYQRLERDKPGNGSTPVTKHRDPESGRLYLSGPQGNLWYTAEADMPPSLPPAGPEAASP